MEVQSVVRGHHIYKQMWSPVTGQELAVILEYNNTIVFYNSSTPGSTYDPWWVWLLFEGGYECEYSSRK